ncbi:unnamed protein product [Vitrella brassicaformis CCMP3155]|uniref:Uncharacterized protein n=1 Tax=Vitrella brassicaformis (strain CCMP3155) TaxID=1169540 RepID=A0A0G4GDQ8_VITBC|nr:unnamed protein product [Vitrella brassicaformis CCMP3155]|eukprot:CEM27402.1 unnamed protein product [Vitrella brassicaformis CCMP3155]
MWKTLLQGEAEVEPRNLVLPSRTAPPTAQRGAMPPAPHLNELQLMTLKLRLRLRVRTYLKRLCNKQPNKYARFRRRVRMTQWEFLQVLSGRYLSKLQRQFLEHFDQVDMASFIDIVMPYMAPPKSRVCADLDEEEREHLRWYAAAVMFDDLDVESRGEITWSHLTQHFICISDLLRKQHLQKSLQTASTLHLDVPKADQKGSGPSLPAEGLAKEGAGGISWEEKDAMATMTGVESRPFTRLPVKAQYHYRPEELHTHFHQIMYIPQLDRLLQFEEEEPTARLLHPKTGERLKCLKGHTRDLLSAVYMPSPHQWLLTSACDKQIIIWDNTASLVRKWTPKVPPSPSQSTTSMIIIGSASPFNASLSSYNSQRLKGSSSRHVSREEDGGERQLKRPPTLAKMPSVSLAGGGGAVMKPVTVSCMQYDAQHHRLFGADPFSTSGRIMGWSFPDPNGIRDVTDLNDCFKLTCDIDKGHSQPVLALCWMPSFEMLASASMDSTIVLWDTIHGREQHRLYGHTKGISSLLFYPELRLLLSAGFDHTIHTWDPASGCGTSTLTGHLSSILSLQRIPDSWETMSLDVSGNIKIWDLRRMSCVQTLKASSELLDDEPLKAHELTAVSRNTIAVCGRFTAFLHRESTEPKVVADKPALTAVLFKRTLQIATPVGRSVTVWSALDGNIEGVLEDLTPSSITAFSVDPTERKCVIGDEQGRLSIHSLSSGYRLKTLHSHPSEITVAKWSGEHLVSFSANEGCFQIHEELPDGRRVQTLRRMTLSVVDVVGVDVLASHHLLAVVGGGGSIHWYKTDTAQLEATTEQKQDEPELPANLVACCFLRNAPLFLTIDEKAKLTFHGLKPLPKYDTFHCAYLTTPSTAPPEPPARPFAIDVAIEDSPKSLAPSTDKRTTPQTPSMLTPSRTPSRPRPFLQTPVASSPIGPAMPTPLSRPSMSSLKASGKRSRPHGSISFAPTIEIEPPEPPAVCAPTAPPKSAPPGWNGDEVKGTQKKDKRSVSARVAGHVAVVATAETDTKRNSGGGDVPASGSASRRSRTSIQWEGDIPIRVPKQRESITPVHVGARKGDPVVGVQCLEVLEISPKEWRVFVGCEGGGIGSWDITAIAYKARKLASPLYQKEMAARGIRPTAHSGEKKVQTKAPDEDEQASPVLPSATRRLRVASFASISTARSRRLSRFMENINTMFETTSPTAPSPTSGTPMRGSLAALPPLSTVPERKDTMLTMEGSEDERDTEDHELPSLDVIATSIGLPVTNLRFLNTLTKVIRAASIFSAALPSLKDLLRTRPEVNFVWWKGKAHTGGVAKLHACNSTAMPCLLSVGGGKDLAVHMWSIKDGTYLGSLRQGIVAHWKFPLDVKQRDKEDKRKVQMAKELTEEGVTRPSSRAATEVPPEAALLTRTSISLSPPKHKGKAKHGPSSKTRSRSPPANVILSDADFAVPTAVSPSRIRIPASPQAFKKQGALLSSSSPASGAHKQQRRDSSWGQEQLARMTKSKSARRFTQEELRAGASLANALKEVGRQDLAEMYQHALKKKS